MAARLIIVSAKTPMGFFRAAMWSPPQASSAAGDAVNVLFDGGGQIRHKMLVRPQKTPMPLVMVLPFFVGEAAAGRSAGPSQMWIFILIFMAIWFLSIAPARKRQKQQKLMLERLRVGDRVLLSSAIFAKVISLKGQSLTVEIAKGVRIEVLRDAVRQLIECECDGDGKKCCEVEGEAQAQNELPDSSTDCCEEEPVCEKKTHRTSARSRTKK